MIFNIYSLIILYIICIKIYSSVKCFDMSMAITVFDKGQFSGTHATVCKFVVLYIIKQEKIDI